MKTKQLKQFFKATALAIALSSSMPTFAQTSDEVVAVVDNSVILRSDLEQSVAETKHQMNSKTAITLKDFQYFKNSIFGLVFTKNLIYKTIKQTLKVWQANYKSIENL